MTMPADDEKNFNTLFCFLFAVRLFSVHLSLYRFMKIGEGKASNIFSNKSDDLKALQALYAGRSVKVAQGKALRHSSTLPSGITD